MCVPACDSQRPAPPAPPRLEPLAPGPAATSPDCPGSSDTRAAGRRHGFTPCGERASAAHGSGTSPPPDQKENAKLIQSLLSVTKATRRRPLLALLPRWTLRPRRAPTSGACLASARSHSPKSKLRFSQTFYRGSIGSTLKLSAGSPPRLPPTSRTVRTAFTTIMKII